MAKRKPVSKRQNKTIGSWCGKPIEKLKRKELLEVIEFMAKELERNRKEKEMMGDDYWELYTRKKLRL
ncbi:MAG: hypothetical protein ACTSXD_03620 [Candidatus Heimdallarchaeaceae archaeon]